MTNLQVYELKILYSNVHEIKLQVPLSCGFPVGSFAEINCRNVEVEPGKKIQLHWDIMASKEHNAYFTASVISLPMGN